MNRVPSRSGGATPPQKTHQTAIVVIPPRVLWGQIQTIRARYDRQYQRWMPHISLVYPFHLLNRLPKEREPLQRACQSLHPFEVELGELKWFRHREQGHTLWLAPQPRHALVELQRALLRAVPDCDDLNHYAQGFEPHLSLGQVQARARLEKVLAELQVTWQPIHFRVEQVSLIARGDPPKDQFRVVEEMRLGPSPANLNAAAGTPSAPRNPPARPTGPQRR